MGQIRVNDRAAPQVDAVGQHGARHLGGGTDGMSMTGPAEAGASGAGVSSPASASMRAMPGQVSSTRWYGQYSGVIAASRRDGRRHMLAVTECQRRS